MKKSECTLLLKAKIIDVQKKLDDLLKMHSINSNLVLKLSEELDILIAEYYNLESRCRNSQLEHDNH